LERAARIHPLAAGSLVALATAILMLATEPFLAIGWDEGYTLGREARLREWFRGLADPPAFAKQWHPVAHQYDLVQWDESPPPSRGQLDTRAKLLFDPAVLAWFWPFARKEPHGHPPFYALLGLAGDLLAPTSWQDLPRARIGPILLFSIANGAIFAFAAARWGTWAGALAAGAWALQPNLFAHGHYAAYDGILTSLWVLAIIAFARGVAGGTGVTGYPIRWWLTLMLGLIFGCAAATKLTGWFLPLPFVVWTALYRSRLGATTLAISLLVAMVVLLALVPPWWTDPVGGVLRFFESNLTRAKTIVIPVLFLGKTYMTPAESLPWYNTLVWTVLVTPVGFLILGIVGFALSLKRWRTESVGVLIAAHWTFVIVLRALPGTPGHDGVRLLLPAFGILALLSGLGAGCLIESGRRWAKAVVVAALMEGVTSVAVMMPVPLSYFSPLVGGLPGATALGMEPTYYWDALGLEPRRWLAGHTPPGRTFQFATFPLSWLYLRQTGQLPRRLYPVDPDEKTPDRPLWFVMQNRPGAFLDYHRALIKESQPAFTVLKLGVPLIWIFPDADFERLYERYRR
jgi:4-amino-4-deoxy-L-arabinose transferase-like glycosyltransferase